MTYRVAWHPTAAAAIEGLALRDPAHARRIRQRVAAFAETEQGDLRKLEARVGQWRLRVGAWRVVFAFEPPGSITVLSVSDRRDAYR